MIYERPMFDNNLVKRFEYDIEITRYIDGQPNKTLDKAIIHPIEVGNKLEFKSKNEAGTSFLVLIKDVIAIKIPQPMQGMLKKEKMLLEMEFYDSKGNQNAMAFNVLDVHVQEILDQVKACKAVEQEYWDTVDLQYILDGKTKTTQLYYKAPFLSEGEELLWINTKVEGIANKRIRWLEALTNFRAIYYDFLKHDSGRIPLIFVEDALIAPCHSSHLSACWTPLWWRNVNFFVEHKVVCGDFKGFLAPRICTDPLHAFSLYSV